MDQNEAAQSEAKLSVSNVDGQLVIKKYANRKFYNTELSQYVTLGQIQNESLTRSVKVIDNKTKQDITRKTLASSLVDTIVENETVSVSDIVQLIKNAKA